MRREEKDERLFQAPTKVIRLLDKLVHDFFQEGFCGDGGIHNVNWEITQLPKLPKLMGGLGTGNFQHGDFVSLTLTMWIWRFLTEENA